MSNGEPCFLALVTAPDQEVAERLAKRILRARLAACANIVPGVQSHYWWQGELESAQELLILFKTVDRCVMPLRELVLEAHPYDVPEFVVLELATGSESYLSWIRESCVSAA